MEILGVAVILISFWVIFDNFRVKRKITRLNGRVERLSENLNVKCNIPKDGLPDELILNCLENQIDGLESAFLDQKCQDKFPKDTQQ